MPLVGGGGAPNVAGSNPAGTSQSLQYVGNNYWAGWSGWINAVNGTDATWFDFTSPLRVAIEVKMYYAFDFDAMSSDKFYGMELTINGQVVMNPKQETVGTGDTRGTSQPHVLKFICFPGDRVTIKGQTDNASAVGTGATIIAQGLYE